MKDPAIYRYNAVTGYWVYERIVSHATAEAWLTIFRADEPNAIFVVASKRPDHRPA